jgi:arabinan endo-1,5-alpha-L-arabinosidase
VHIRMTLTALLWACGGCVAAMGQPPAPPVFAEVSVHDPDVLRVDGVYYIFGSHLAAARSPDLIRWTLIGSGVRDDNPIIPDAPREMAEGLAWAQSDTFWAGCVAPLRDGRFAFYYCMCKGDSPRSALGLAIADRVEGPYRHDRILLRSGMWGQPGEDGAVYDATVHPNAVDPAVFDDAEGRRWMVYGSYSGGIFILRLDADTGLPLPGQGYGKKLLGGNHARIEAPHIFYHPDTGWYYLTLSYGGLAADGGYQMRVARSRAPDGPYVDPLGNDMIHAAGPAGTFFDDAAIAPYGAKLMGNFRFPGPDGGAGWGYVSPGHNSVYRDPDTGRCFLVFHTRFPGRGERHEVRVHPLLLNAQGWPVVAPQRYAGESWNDGTTYTVSDVAGTYDFIRHGRDITTAINEPRPLTLHADGAVSGAFEGAWSVFDGSMLKLNAADVTYDGVFLKQWDPLREAWVMTLTALSSAGEMVWGSRVDPRSAPPFADTDFE